MVAWESENALAVNNIGRKAIKTGNVYQKELQRVLETAHRM